MRWSCLDHIVASYAIGTLQDTDASVKFEQGARGHPLAIIMARGPAENPGRPPAGTAKVPTSAGNQKQNEQGAKETPEPPHQPSGRPKRTLTAADGDPEAGRNSSGTGSARKRPRTSISAGQQNNGQQANANDSAERGGGTAGGARKGEKRVSFDDDERRADAIMTSKYRPGAAPRHEWFNLKVAANARRLNSHVGIVQPVQGPPPAIRQGRAGDGVRQRRRMRNYLENGSNLTGDWWMVRLIGIF